MFRITAVNRLLTFHEGFREFVTFFKTKKGTSFVTSLIMTSRDQLLIISDQFEIGDDQNWSQNPQDPEKARNSQDRWTLRSRELSETCTLYDQWSQ